jgi:hypothetical protein
MLNFLLYFLIFLIIYFYELYIIRLYNYFLIFKNLYIFLIYLYLILLLLFFFYPLIHFNFNFCSFYDLFIFKISFFWTNSSLAYILYNIIFIFIQFFLFFKY